MYKGIGRTHSIKGIWWYCTIVVLSISHGTKGLDRHIVLRVFVGTVGNVLCSPVHIPGTVPTVLSITWEYPMYQCTMIYYGMSYMDKGFLWQTWT